MIAWWLGFDQILRMDTAWVNPKSFLGVETGAKNANGPRARKQKKKGVNSRFLVLPGSLSIFTPDCIVCVDNAAHL